jgi:hypothetical protein
MSIFKKISEAKNDRPVSPLRRLAYLGIGLGVFILAVALFILVFGNMILNGYGKRRVQQAFVAGHPGSTLQIGKLSYAIGASRLDVQSIALSTTSSSFKVDRISVAGIRVAPILRGKATLADILAKASLDAANLDVEFRGPHYGIRCKRLRASVPNSDLVAEGTDFSPMAGDEAIYIAHPTRTTRYRVFMPEFRVSGLAYGELLQGKSYRARSVHLVRPTFDAFSYHYTPGGPFKGSPHMVNGALAAIPRPVQVDSLIITDGYGTFRDRVAVGAPPGMLTFTGVNLSAAGITNRGDSSAAIALRAKGKLMDAGVLEVLMTIPLNPRDFSLHYTGSLGAMDMTRIDAFLDVVDRIHINSGKVEKIDFAVDVTAGHALGSLHAIYRDLNISVLDRTSGTKEGVGHRVASFMANQFKFRDSNAPEKWASMKVGKVDYKRNRSDTFLQCVWLPLQGGVLDVINRDAR